MYYNHTINLREHPLEALLTTEGNARRDHGQETLDGMQAKIARSEIFRDERLEPEPEHPASHKQLRKAVDAPVLYAQSSPTDGCTDHFSATLTPCSELGIPNKRGRYTTSAIVRNPFTPCLNPAETRRQIQGRPLCPVSHLASSPKAVCIEMSILYTGRKKQI